MTTNPQTPASSIDTQATDDAMQPGDTATCRYPNHWGYGREADTIGITERGAYRIRVGCDVICLEAIYLERKPHGTDDRRYG